MTESSVKIANRLQAFLESGDEGAYQSAIIATMKVLIEANEAMRGLQRALVEGKQNEDAMVLIAGLQKFHDDTVKLVAREDNGIRHSVEVRPDNFVTRAINKATRGEFRIMTSENPVTGSMVNRALAEGLRRRAEELSTREIPAAEQDEELAPPAPRGL